MTDDPIWETEQRHAGCNAEIARLRASHAALLAVLKVIVNAYGDKTWGTVFAMERELSYAREAIANAEKV